MRRATRDGRGGEAVAQVIAVADVRSEHAEGRIVVGDQTRRKQVSNWADEVVAGSPGIERIVGFEARVESRGDRCLVVRR